MKSAVFTFFAYISLAFSYDNFTFTKQSSEVELLPVTVSGAVVQPGTYYVPPALHVLDMIKLASGGNLPDLKTIDCRSIEIVSGNHVTKIDLLRYLSNSDDNQNPFISSGMIVKIGYTVHFAFVQGDIQGTITDKVPIRPGESIGELISLFTLNTTADSSKILLYRLPGEIKQYTLQELDSITVHDRDFISVLSKKDFPILSSVKLSGEAARPGVYPVVHGKTHVADILSIAGGASLQGDLSRTFIIRKAKLQKQPASAFVDGQNDIRPEVTGGFKYLAASSDYAVIPSVPSTLQLEDGDEIVIPKMENSIYISGCVKRPGVYAFSKGMSASYYIKESGGYTSNADKRNVKVITPFTNSAYAIGMSDKLNAGDIIMVPEAQEDKWFKHWSPFIQITSGVVSAAGIIIGIISLKN